MSKTGVEQVIGRLLTDAAFRSAVVADPSTALAGFDLTDEERGAFTRLDPAMLDGAASDLDQRFSRAFVGLGKTKRPSNACYQS